MGDGAYSHSILHRMWPRIAEANYQQKYGDSDASSIHIRAWKDALLRKVPNVAQLDGENQVVMITGRVIDSARYHSRRLASSDALPLVYRPLCPMHRAFCVFVPIDAAMLGIFKAASLFHYFDPTGSNAVPRIREILLQVFLGDVPIGGSNKIKTYAMYQVRNAVCAIGARWYADIRINEQLEFSGDFQEIMRRHLQAVRALDLVDFEVLIGTAYQEVSFWSLWVSVVCPAAWTPRILQVLRAFQWNLGIRRWEDVHTILKRYSHPEELFGLVSKTLFDAVGFDLDE